MRTSTICGALITLREPIPETDGPIRERWFAGDRAGVFDAFMGAEPDTDQILRIRSELEDPLRWVWTIDLRDTPVGIIRLSKMNPSTRTVALFYYVAVEARRQGVATDAINVIKTIAFDLPEVNLIETQILSTNEPSIRRVKAAGFDHMTDREHSPGLTVQIWIFPTPRGFHL